MQTRNEIKSASDAEILRHWLDWELPRGLYNKAKERIVEECLVPKSHLSNWMYGGCRIPMAAKRDINRVTLELTGKEIFTIHQMGKKSL